MLENAIGITLNDIARRYPYEHQPLMYDALLDIDATYKPKMISSFQLAVNSIITLLMMKPGQYPSIPELGIDINKYLHEYSDDQSVIGEIKSKLTDQCNRLDLTGIDIDMRFDTTSDGYNALVIEISGDEYVGTGPTKRHFIIGISYDDMNRLYSKTYSI